jgi:hypothetical protein
MNHVCHVKTDVTLIYVEIQTNKQTNKQARTHARTHATHPPTHPHIHTHTPTHTHIHTYREGSRVPDNFIWYTIIINCECNDLKINKN